MELVIYMSLVIMTTFVIIAINEVAKEVRGMRSVFESHYQLERIPVKAESPYKRKGVEL